LVPGDRIFPDGISILNNHVYINTLNSSKIQAQLKALRDPNSKTNPFGATTVALGSS
jgi:hypothetical protein